MRDEAHRIQLERTRQYWSETNALYLQDVGHTFQAGFLRAANGEATGCESNRELARLARIQAGHRVLDAGCGVCGPAIDIASSFDDVKVCGLTISPEQASVARRRIEQAGLRGRVAVAIGDYHELAFEDGVFDVVLFLESAGYSHDPELLFQEARRVLRPGGIVFVKDVCCKEGPLSQDERAGLELFNDTFAYLTRRISEIALALRASGFERVQAEDITHRVSRDHQIGAMFDLNGDLRPTAFGRRHLVSYPALPTVYGMVVASRPG